MANYKEGYVAFLDILGFSNYVKSNENDARSIEELFEFVDKLKQIFNSKSGIELDFFSDSIILMTDRYEFNNFLFPIWMAETYLSQEFGLLFRGAITKGKYYHDSVNTFGPAIVTAYELESRKAKYSRIILDDESVPKEECWLDVFMDIDGVRCLNNYSFALFPDIPQEYNGTEYSREEMFKMLTNSLGEIRNNIFNLFELKYGDECSREHMDKYVWRSVPFNYLCDYICENPDEIEYLEKHYSKFNETEKEKIQKFKINLDDWINAYSGLL